MTFDYANHRLTLDRLIAIADRFSHTGHITHLHPLGNGNINDTFLVALDDPSQRQFVLQRINTQVFRQPHLVMQNMRILTEHARRRLQAAPIDRRWELPSIILTQDGQGYWREPDGSFWRAISFIDGSQSFDTLRNPAQAQEVGYALGMFHHLISDLSPDRMSDTLPGFHITPLYLAQYEALPPLSCNISPEVAYGLRFIRERAPWAPVLETAKAQGKLPLRLMHGDPKVNNVMFDTATQVAVGVVDLDTVKPGLVHYDIGDCLRSGCNPAGEETPQWETVEFDLDLCQGILRGYLSIAKYFLTDNDYAYLFDAIRLMAFELGLRFFTDHLAGDVYFKVKYPEHNLMRALVQFKLTESIEAQKTTIRHLIQDLK